MSHLDVLVTTYASPSLGKEISTDNPIVDSLTQFDRSGEFERLLRLRNGFTALEDSLHIFPLDDTIPQNLAAWNEWNLWKQDYSFALPEFFSFGENLFGEQFCFCENGICQFDPETGALAHLADSLEGWAATLLEDLNYHTGYSLLRQWRESRGPLLRGHRLVPKVPFVCGGDYAVDNLFAVDALHGMRTRASLANQLFDLPDGAPIQFRTIDR